MAASIANAKFNQLVVRVLTEGPKDYKEIYRIALETQPQDCPDIRCNHRGPACKAFEWQHEIQRRLFRIGDNIEGVWHLKATVAVEKLKPPLPILVEIVEVAEVIEVKVLEEVEISEEAENEIVKELEELVTAVEVEPEGSPHSDLPVLYPISSYTGDSFIIRDGHYVDVEELKKPSNEQFVVPMNFDEFWDWKPEYVQNWVKRRLNRFTVDDEVEDWTQDLIIHLKYLPSGPKGSIHRLPGANGRPQGCQDVIETFNPVRQYGASERRFRNYINWCLANKFNTVLHKHQNNPVLRPGNLSFGMVLEEGESEHKACGDEFIYANSKFLSVHAEKVAKQHDDRFYTNQFKQFVSGIDPGMVPTLEAMEFTNSIKEAAEFLGVTDSEFTRLRNRLKQLGECFEDGSRVPKRRQPYKKRLKALQAPGDVPNVLS